MSSLSDQVFSIELRMGESGTLVFNIIVITKFPLLDNSSNIR